MANRVRSNIKGPYFKRVEGVFVAVNSKFTSTVDTGTNLETDYQLLWVRVKKVTRPSYALEP